MDDWKDGTRMEQSISSTVPTDSELMEGIARREETAFEAIYDRYASMLYSICFRILRHEFEAREVLSEVFLELWEKASRYDQQRGSSRAYLVTMTRCRAIDRLRSMAAKSHDQTRLSKVWHATSSRRTPAFAPHEHMERDEEIDLLRDAMDRLNANQFQILSMAYFEGLTHAEIAQALKIPLGTAKTTIRRSIAILREFISGLNRQEVEK